MKLILKFQMIFDYDDLEIDDQELTILNTEITFVNESSVAVFSNFSADLSSQSSQKTATVASNKHFVCETCGKKYIKSAFYTKHVSSNVVSLKSVCHTLKKVNNRKLPAFL